MPSLTVQGRVAFLNALPVHGISWVYREKSERERFWEDAVSGSEVCFCRTKKLWAFLGNRNVSLISEKIVVSTPEHQTQIHRSTVWCLFCLHTIHAVNLLPPASVLMHGKLAADAFPKIQKDWSRKEVNVFMKWHEQYCTFYLAVLCI